MDGDTPPAAAGSIRTARRGAGAGACQPGGPEAAAREHPTGAGEAAAARPTSILARKPLFPQMFHGQAQGPEACGAAAILAALEALRPTGGKLSVFLSSMPTSGVLSLKTSAFSPLPSL